MTDKPDTTPLFAVVLNCPKGFANHREALAWLDKCRAEIESHHPVADEPEPAGKTSWGTWVMMALLLGGLFALMRYK